MSSNVHLEPIDFIEIPAPQHGENSYYRVCYGDVDWQKNGELHRSIYVAMRYGERVNYRRVAHILTTVNDGNNEYESDLTKVMNAIEHLTKKYQL